MCQFFQLINMSTPDSSGDLKQCLLAAVALKTRQQHATKHRMAVYNLSGTGGPRSKNAMMSRTVVVSTSLKPWKSIWSLCQWALAPRWRYSIYFETALEVKQGSPMVKQWKTCVKPPTRRCICGFLSHGGTPKSFILVGFSLTKTIRLWVPPL